MRKRLVLVVVVFLLGIVAMWATGKFGVIVPFVVWVTVAMFEENLLEVTKISSATSSSLFIFWTALWFANGPVLFRNDIGIVHNLGPSMHDLVLAIAGSLLCFLVTFICHRVERGLPTRLRHSNIKRYR